MSQEARRLGVFGVRTGLSRYFLFIKGRADVAMDLPLVQEIEPVYDIEEFYGRLRVLPYSFFLDSGMMIRGLGEYTFLGADPFLVLSAEGGKVTLDDGKKVQTISSNPLDVLKALVRKYSLPSRPDFPVPFCGGAVGYFSYDLGRVLEKLPEKALDDLKTPDLCLGFYDVIVAVDNVSKRFHIISTGFPESDPERAAQRAKKRLDYTRKVLETPVLNADVTYTGMKEMVELKSNFNKKSYCRAVQRAKDYITAGDIYQVNLSQRFSLPLTIDPWLIYRRLRTISPAPMAAFLDFNNFKAACASMERFIKLSGRHVQTRPIKGTRPRGRDLLEDLRMRNELWSSVKDRAELVMIVDLERNDLGKVCRVGSVRVPELYRLEEYATVFHLVSTVEGELSPGMDMIDLLKATFPGGSITGAPKIRAMEIIDELEPVRRGIYTGSIGYIGFDGNADLNIVIRTLVFKDDNVYFQVGGGITIDSDPELEYAETIDKGRALVRSLGLSEERFINGRSYFCKR